MPAGTQVASLFGVLSLDDSSFNKGMDSADGRLGSTSTKLQNFAGGVTGIIGDVGKAAAVGATAIVGATTAIGVGMFEMAKDAAPIEGIRKAFEGMAEASGESADAMLKSLADSAKGTIKNTDLMMSYNKATQLVSSDFANQLPEAMQYLTKVAAATGQDISFMLDSLVTGVGRASPMILDNLGIQVNLAEATDEYAKSIGKTSDQLTKSEVQMAISNKALELLKKNTAAMPDITDNAATKWAQFETKLANFKDDVGVKLLPFFERVIDLFMKLADAVLPYVMPLVEQVAGGFTTLVGVMWNMDTILSRGGIPLAISAIVNAFLQMFGLVGREDMSPIATSIGDFIGKPLQMIGDLIQNVVLPALQRFGNWFMQEALPAIVGFVTGTVIPAIQRFIGILQSIWSMVAPVLTAVVDWFINTGLPLAVGFIRDTMIPYVQKLIDGIMVIWEKVQPGLQSLFDWFVTTGLPLITSFIQDIAMPIINEIIRIIGDIWTTVAPALGDLAAWFLEEALPSVLDFITNTALPVIQSIIDILTSIWTVVQPYLSSFKDGVVGVFNDIKKIIEPVIGFINDVISKFNDLKNLVTGGVGALGGAAENAATAAGMVTSGQVSAGDFWTALGNAVSAEFRAGGGPVAGGMPYIVGEQGPELFTPSTSGHISTAGETAAMMGDTYNININANSYEGGAAAGRGFMDAIKARGG